jgi:hypothetical protein
MGSPHAWCRLDGELQARKPYGLGLQVSRSMGDEVSFSSAWRGCRPAIVLRLFRDGFLRPHSHDCGRPAARSPLSISITDDQATAKPCKLRKGLFPFRTTMSSPVQRNSCCSNPFYNHLVGWPAPPTDFQGECPTPLGRPPFLSKGLHRLTVVLMEQRRASLLSVT